LYKKTSGSERVQIVDAMERILKEGSGQPPAVTAQLVHIAASLDIAQLEPAVKELASKAPTLGDPVRKAVDNFLAFRQLRSH